ncbi:MAG: response regulator transcription factor [Brevundimonas sp.]
MRVLLVEDEPEMAAALGEAFRRNHILHDHAPSLYEAEVLADAFAFDALVLDRHLPDGDGLSLIPRLRAKRNPVPVLVLTAQGEVADRVEGLDHGADDYLAKPFAVEELLARLRALRRRPSDLQSEIVVVGRLSFDHVSRDARVDEAPLDLTRRERLLLEALVRHFGRMAPRSFLMDAVFAMDDEVQPNALDLHVSRLRRKLAGANAGLVVNVIRGVGYLLREEA